MRDLGKRPPIILDYIARAVKDKRFKGVENLFFIYIDPTSKKEGQGFKFSTELSEDLASNPHSVESIHQLLNL